MKDCKEAITIPDGCYATIEGNKVVFRKWAYPTPRALEVAALHWRMNNCPSSPDTIGAFVSGAEWQKKQTCEQAMKYLQEHHSPSELSDFQAAMNIAVAKAIDSTINKSIEWLKDNIHYDDFGGNMEWYVPFADDDEMVENFKKFMEE